MKTPGIALKEWGNISEFSDDESSEDDNAGFEFSDIVNGNYVVVRYAGKCNVVYYAAVVTSLNNDVMFNVSFFKCNGKKHYNFDENDHDEVGAECLFKKLALPEIKQKLDHVYYYFNCVDCNPIQDGLFRGCSRMGGGGKKLPSA